MSWKFWVKDKKSEADNALNSLKEQLTRMGEVMDTINDCLTGNNSQVAEIAVQVGIAVLKEWKGITIKQGGFHVIIPRNTTIPVTRTDKFYTAADGQAAASIEIYQGEGEWVKNNHRLGEFLLEGIPPNRAGAEVIEVTYRYNLNGILEVTARCMSTGKEMSVTVQDALDRDSEEAFEESKAGLEALFSSAGDELEDKEDKEEWDSLAEILAGEVEEEMDEDVVSPTVLHEEASRLRGRAVGPAGGMQGRLTAPGAEGY